MNAIKIKNQSKVTRAVNWLIKHNEADKLRNIADGNGDQKAWKKANNKCESTFDKFTDLIEELPKYEQKAIYNSELY